MCQQSTITRELVDLEPTRSKNAFHNHGYNSPQTKIESITRTCISHFQWISDIVIKRSSFPFFVIPFGSIFTLIYTGHKTVSEGSSYLGLQAILPRCLWWNILGTKNFQTKLKPFTSGKDFLNCKRDPSFSHGPLISLLTTLAPPQKPSKKTNPKMERSTSVSNK